MFRVVLSAGPHDAGTCFLSLDQYEKHDRVLLNDHPDEYTVVMCEPVESNSNVVVLSGMLGKRPVHTEIQSVMTLS